MFYHIEILLFRDGDDEKPQIFPLAEEDERAASLPQEGDFIVIEKHMGRSLPGRSPTIWTTTFAT